MVTQQINLFHIPFEELFEIIQVHYPLSSYDYGKHQVSVISNADEQLGVIRLPLHIALDQQFKIISENTTILYLSIESGSSTIALNRGKSTISHTSVSSYMSRKKQGFSQIKYLNKKGKSRAGSRVRLNKTIEFFEKINEKLTAFLTDSGIDRIAISCTASLVPYLHQSKVKCPFQKDDPRLYKIPLHIPQSNYTNLQAAIKKLKAPILYFDEQNQEALNELIIRANK